MFSPPRMMSSLSRPSSLRYPPSISPRSPVRNQPSTKDSALASVVGQVPGRDTRALDHDLAPLPVRTTTRPLSTMRIRCRSECRPSPGAAGPAAAGSRRSGGWPRSCRRPRARVPRSGCSARSHSAADSAELHDRMKRRSGNSAASSPPCSSSMWWSVGPAENHVTRCVRRCSAEAAAARRCLGTTTVPPAASVDSVEATSPWTWNSGITQ